jgi:ABC-type Fe3+ transport system substrate-binding protein
MLWHRWIISEEGQRAMAEAGRIPPYPNVQATEPIKPRTIFPLTAEDEKQFSRYERVWKDIFQLR